MRKAESLNAAADLNAARPRYDTGPSRSLLADLLALRELQASLALEESDESVVRVGANAIVEILTLDGGLALIDGFSGRPDIRFGWRQGRAMPSREIDTLSRAVERELADVRAGRSGNLLLSTRAGTAPAAMAPAAARDLGFAAILILGLGSGGRRNGTLVLGSRDQDAFSGERMILAEILASQMSEQCERVRLQEMTDSIEPRARAAAERASRALQARIAALEAQAAIATVASVSFESDRQVELVLRKAIEVSRHAGGAVYLVETNAAGDDLMRFASGHGDAAWLERARLPRWRRGEGLAGSVWESGRGTTIDDLDSDTADFDGEAMRRAEYRRMCCEPLLARGRVIGVLALLGADKKPYDSAEREMLRAIADQVGVAIDNARLLGDVMSHSLDLEWQVERLSTERARSARDRGLLIDLVVSAAGASPLDLQAAEMLDWAVDLAGADAAAVLAHEPGARRFRLLAQRGLNGDAEAALLERPADDPVLSRCLERDQETIVDLASPAILASAPWARRIGCRHVAVVPCRAADAFRGALLVASRYCGWPGEEGRSALAATAGLFGLVLRDEAGVRRHVSHDAAARTATTTARAPLGAPPGAGVERASDKELLAQAQKMDSLRSLAPDIAHDVNNTLGAIMGYASHIRDLVPDHNPVHEKAAVIVKQSQHVADLARQVLSFAHGGSRTRQPIALPPLFEETITLLARSFGPAISIEVRCPEDLPMVNADAGQIRQALINLAMNARDAMPQGGRLVFEGRSGHIDATTAAGIAGLLPGDYVSIVVQDTGAGMTEEIARHAFEPFFTTKEAVVRCGLGLTVVHDIARDHGGHVALSSAPGFGTAVRLYLPACRVRAPRSESDRALDPREPQAACEDVPTAVALDDTSGDLAESSMAELCVATASTLARPETANESGRPRRVLVVDDEPLLADMAAEMMRSRGYEVLVAHDGVAALDIYRKEWGRIGLVLLDMIMPRLSGLETCRRLLGMDRSARILICSGYSNNHQAQEAIKEGALGLLPKPFDMRELLAWVEKGLRD